MRVLKSLYSERARTQIFFFLLLQNACIYEKKTFQTPVQLHEDPEVFGSV